MFNYLLLMVKTGGKKMVEKNVSPRFSFAGYDPLIWLKGNWGDIKPAFRVVAPYLFGTALFANNPILIGVTTIIGKAVLDAIDFYFSKVEIKN